MSESEVRQRKTHHEIPTEHEENRSKSSSKQQKSSSSSSIVLVILTGIIALVLYVLLVESPIEPTTVMKSGPLPYFDGVLAPNTILQKVEKVGTGELPGPESLQVDGDGNVYTGLSDGRIMKVTKSGKVFQLVRTGSDHPNCGEEQFEHLCGRPLGLQLDKTNENLFICDGYIGLLKLHLKTNHLSVLIPASVGVNEVPFKLLNSVAISTTGKLYFTDSSWKWNRRDFIYLALEGNGQGRLISFDLNTSETEVLLDGLSFANGVALSPDEDYLIVSETTTSSILKLWLTGERKGIYEVFADNLPGYPDNIRNSKDGNYWIGLSSIRKQPFSFLDIIGPYPRVRSILAKLIPKSVILRLVKNYGLVLKLDIAGDIVASYHDASGAVVGHVSEVCEDMTNGVLYFGSFHNSQNFIGKLPVSVMDGE